MSDILNILLAGANGRMGRTVAAVVSEQPDLKIAAGIDITADDSQMGKFKIYQNIKDYKDKADVIIDFSHPSGLKDLLEYAAETGTPAVIAITGLSPEHISMLEECSKHIPVFTSANMSLGVNLLLGLAKKCASVLGGSFNIEIIEKHHNQKLDAPSGTALMIADAISPQLEQEPAYIYDRHTRRQKRDPYEIGIHTVRGGTIVGEHDVMFAGKDEVITISHSALSRDVFATGAVYAARFIVGKASGLYGMSDLVGSI